MFLNVWAALMFQNRELCKKQSCHPVPTLNMQYNGELAKQLKDCQGTVSLKVLELQSLQLDAHVAIT